MGRAVYQGALSCNTDGSEYIVPSAHDLPDSSCFEFPNRFSCRRLQLILKDDKAYEIEPSFRFVALHFLQRSPVEGDLLCRASYDTEPPLSVEV